MRLPTRTPNTALPNATLDASTQVKVLKAPPPSLCLQSKTPAKAVEVVSPLTCIVAVHSEAWGEGDYLYQQSRDSIFGCHREVYPQEDEKAQMGLGSIPVPKSVPVFPV